MTEDREPNLKDGSEWADHEDCIVGNEQGLKNLIVACENALESGEYYGSDLGDYVGVKKLDGGWFKSPSESSETRFLNAGLAVFLVLIVGLVLVGLVSVIKWLF